MAFIYFLLGIMPTPQLNPSLDTTNFQNTAAYWSVKCNMTLEVDLESTYALGSTIHATNDEVILFPARDSVTHAELEPFAMESYGN